MRKGFAQPLVSVIVIIVIIATGTIAYFQLKPKVSPLPVPTQSPQSTLNLSPTPITQQSEPTSKVNPCIEDQIGDIKYKFPPNWRKLDNKCDTRVYLSPGVEFSGFDPSQQEGAVISIGNIQLANSMNSECKSDNPSLKPIKCTVVNGNKLYIFRRYEGSWSSLIYSLSYKNRYYEFWLSGKEETKFQPVLEQIVNNLEFL